MVEEELVFSWQRNGYLKLLTLKVNDRMVIIKEFIQCIIVSVHAVHYGLEIARNIYFYDILINLITKLGEKETVVKLGDSNGHAGSNREEY